MGTSRVILSSPQKEKKRKEKEERKRSERKNSAGETGHSSHSTSFHKTHPSGKKERTHKKSSSSSTGKSTEKRDAQRTSVNSVEGGVDGESMDVSDERPRNTLHSSLHHPAAREWLDVHIHPSMLVYPVFVTRRTVDKNIPGFSPNKQWGCGQNKDFASLAAYLHSLQMKGLRSVMLFGVVDEQEKDNVGGKGYDDPDTPVCLALRVLKKACPKLMLLADVCLCEYTDHGHCGTLRKVDGEELIDNDKTLTLLSKCAVLYAQAGAHMVCPSDMMDGRVEVIRKALDRNNYGHVSIMAYTSKKASCLYAPFRAAVESTFKGDRKRYQQPVGSASIAERAATRDIEQGADVILVKPCLWFGDIIRSFAERKTVPVAAYVVSGEYKMLQDYATATGDLEGVLKESHTSIVRAGATILITYFTPALLDYIPSW